MPHVQGRRGIAGGQPAAERGGTDERQRRCGRRGAESFRVAAQPRTVPGAGHQEQPRDQEDAPVEAEQGPVVGLGRQGPVPPNGPPGVAAPAMTAVRTPSQPLSGPSQPVMISCGMTAAI